MAAANPIRSATKARRQGPCCSLDSGGGSEKKDRWVGRSARPMRKAQVESSLLKKGGGICTPHYCGFLTMQTVAVRQTGSIVKARKPRHPLPQAENHEFDRPLRGSKASRLGLRFSWTPRVARCLLSPVLVIRQTLLTESSSPKSQVSPPTMGNPPSSRTNRRASLVA